MSLRDASALTPSVKMSDILSGLSPNYKVKRLIVLSPKYMRKLESILGSTSHAVLRSYLIWKATQSFYLYIDSPIVKPYAAFVRELDGFAPDSPPERWRICTGHVDRGLGWMLDRFFVERAFSEAAKDFGGHLVSDIKNQFIAKLQRSKWMDTETAGKAIEKVRNISPYIGYPTQSPDITNPDALKSFYKTVSISSATHFKNALSMAMFAVKDNWSMLGAPVNHGRWPTSVTIVDASYHPAGNNIMIPAGIMQFPVWSADVPDYVSYGAFGFVIGHEVSHSLDATGRRYDQNGRYGADWWTNKTAEAFAERAECFVDQYSNFTVRGPGGRPLHVNGWLTLDDNIADAGGVSTSFQAWRARRVVDGPSPDAATRLPGLQNFTESQIFFVSYANWWCSKQRPETAVTRIYTDPHAPEWARILGAMANSREFLDSFSCANRVPTCELW
jgi:endothelin-converting enzyme